MIFDDEIPSMQEMKCIVDAMRKEPNLTQINDITTAVNGLANSITELLKLDRGESTTETFNTLKSRLLKDLRSYFACKKNALDIMARRGLFPLPLSPENIAVIRFINTFLERPLSPIGIAKDCNGYLKLKVETLSCNQESNSVIGSINPENLYKLQQYIDDAPVAVPVRVPTAVGALRGLGYGAVPLCVPIVPSDAGADSVGCCIC